ncbi:MAG: glycoside hydrolase family 125 protein, partial [Sphaerochaetaceae bacterium]
SPIIAIDSYIKKIKDSSILSDKEIETLIIRIIQILEEKKEEKSGLYETFLQPTDDTIKYPYLTYNNVLVWKNYKILESWNFQNEKEKWKNLALKIKQAINKNCIKEIENIKQYVWSVDTNGNFEIYDEPPGSLILLPVFGFCSKEDKIYINTCNRINDPSYRYSFSNSPFGAIGCAHAPHPWILSLANSIRVNHDESSINKLMNSNMDGKIACESIDENTGECTTGKACATCAGYLAYALYQERKKYE